MAERFEIPKLQRTDRNRIHIFVSQLIWRPKFSHAQLFGNHFRRDAEFWRDARGDVVQRAHFIPIFTSTILTAECRAMLRPCPRPGNGFSDLENCFASLRLCVNCIRVNLRNPCQKTFAPFCPCPDCGLASFWLSWLGRRFIRVRCLFGG